MKSSCEDLEMFEVQSPLRCTIWKIFVFAPHGDGNARERERERDELLSRIRYTMIIGFSFENLMRMM